MREIFAKMYGNVQAVGFRQYAKKQADKLDLVGWVRNMEDGSVECVAQGDEEDLKTFVGHLKNGPYFADVDNIQVEWYDKLQDEFSEFRIVK